MPRWNERGSADPVLKTEAKPTPIAVRITPPTSEANFFARSLCTDSLIKVCLSKCCAYADWFITSNAGTIALAGNSSAILL